MREEIEELLHQMMVEEKISLLAGASKWYTTPVERLGIPAIKVTDGPNGARGGGVRDGGVTAACFPVGIALASTWNTALIEEVGRALGEEAKTKGAHMLLAPTVNIHRSPLNGRNFECYSEDPYLSARIAVAFIRGVQSQSVGATIKHYMCNDSEFQRTSISSEVSERALREIYLPPFKAAIQEAKPWAVMASYNKFRGTFTSENAYILIDILRKEWGFEGLVMSDWWGTKSTVEALNAGLDLEMPGPSQYRGEKLLNAFQDGKIDEATIDERVSRLLAIIIKSGQFENPQDPPEQAVDKPEHREIARRAATEGIVLLKNDKSILPLNADRMKSLAIIGPNAKDAKIMGGGSAQVDAHYVITPFEGIVNKVGDLVNIGFEIGCTNHRSLPVLNPQWLTPVGGEADHGLTAEYFNNLDLFGIPVWTTLTNSTAQRWFGKFSPDIDPCRFSARFTGTFTAPETGKYTFSLSSTGRSRLFIGGKNVIDNWEDHMFHETSDREDNRETTFEMEMTAGNTYDFRIEYSEEQIILFSSLRLGCLLPIADDVIDRAVSLAAQSDVALVFVGLGNEWESEGFDRPDMELVGKQVELIENVAAANENTIVVLNTGAPITMNWLDKVAAVVQAWYPGQECGNAIADILFGDVNPSGRLPQTFPKRLEDNPAYINYPGEHGKVYYGEGIFVGYRYYEKKKIDPLFSFGYGLSYTTFAYSNLRLSASEIEPDEEIQVAIDVQNTGTRAGQEVVQVYVRDPESSVIRPEKELKAFAKVSLLPGETKTVTMTLNRESLAYYDVGVGQWVAEAGIFDVLVGSSSQDIRATAQFTLKASGRFGDSHKPTIILSTASPLRELLEHEEARKVLTKHLPELINSPHFRSLGQFTLDQLANFAPDIITDKMVHAIANEL